MNTRAILTQYYHIKYLIMNIFPPTSISKMNILPRVNVCGSVIPLSPPPEYWEKLHGKINHFTREVKCARIKLNLKLIKRYNKKVSPLAYVYL